MFDVNEYGPATVRFVSVKNRLGTKRVRVNIIYERGFERDSSSPAETSNWLTDAPPSIDLEGYVDDVPEWGGIEQEVSSADPIWDVSDANENEIIGLVKSSIEDVSNPDLWDSESLARSDGLISSRHSSTRKRKALKSDARYRYTAENGDLSRRNATVAAHNNSEPDGTWDLHASCLDEDEMGNDVNGGRCAAGLEFRSERTAFCRICDIHVKSTLRRMHIYSCHLRRPMYRCPICDLSSTYHLSNIRVHIRKVHNVMTEPICLKEEYENEVNAFLYSCFGDHQIFRRQDPDVVACVIAILNCVSNGLPAPMGNVSDFCSRNSGQVRRDVPAVEGSAFNEQSAILARTQSRNTCRLCFESNVKHLERHVLQHHIKQPMFLCPCCSFSSCYSPTSVKDHIKTRHSLFDPVPLDVRDEYAELIQTVYNQCFVDDTSVITSKVAFKQHS